MNKEYFEVREEGMIKGPPPQSCVIVICGASGDLTHRELIPSLYELNCKKLLPEPCAIVGFARREWDDEGFRNEMKNAAKESTECDSTQWDDFAGNLFYVPGDFKDDSRGAYRRLKEKIDWVRKGKDIPDNILYHLAVPPAFYGTIIQRLKPAGLADSESGWRRAIIEKPFGEDENSARELDRQIHQVFEEEQIYRVDHFLGKETVQNMLVFRFANPGFEPIWNRNYIDNVQITVAEDLGIGTRGNFYEKTGVIRDMVQNHLLQLLCITAIEPPVKFDADSLRTETSKVLKSLCETNIEQDCVLGQYASGEIEGAKVAGYRQEKNVAEDSITPTYAAMKLMLDNWRWADVPFYLRTGKRMNRKLTEVTIQFKPTPHLMFPVKETDEQLCSILTFRLQPDEGIIYQFMAKQPGAQLRLRPVKMNFRYDTAFGTEEPPSAYQWLLFDAMRGDQTLFPRSNWIYQAWKFVDPIVKKWETKPWLSVPNYRSGSQGPVEAERLIRKDGRNWIVF